MGFSCFICAGPFDEGPSPSENGGGDGFKEVPIKPVSAIVKCGHLFHSDCLKKVLEAQSTNAWTPKSCPVCRVLLNVHDIVRVHANPYDNRSEQRPRMEEIMMVQGKLRDENNSLYKNLEMMRSQMRDMDLERETTKRQKEEVTLRLEQMGRLIAIHKADMERYKGEIEKLKNIIITLTGKLTGNENSLHDYYGSGNNTGMSASNLCRLEYTDELQRVPICDASMSQNIIQGSIPKPNTNHPPGFLYPISNASMKNGPNCPDGDHGSQIASRSPDGDTPENVRGAISVPGNGSMKNLFQMPEENHQALRFTMPNVQVRDFDTNNNNSGIMHKSEETYKNANENIPVKAADTSCSSLGSSNLVAGKNDNLSFIASIQNEINDMEDDYVEGDHCIENWSEKRSRRRASSKSSGSASRSRGNRHSGKYEALVDKKLLYGSFLCPTCKAKWGSSQSILNTPQTCRYCRTEVHPYNQGPILPRKQLEAVNKQSTNGSKVAITSNKKK